MSSMDPEAERLYEQARALLRVHWGFSAFRSGQEAVIRAVLAGRDVLAVLPTGAGKSVCYQVPALLQEGLTLVVSPLLSLMEDQVTSLQDRGISAAFINSTLTLQEVDQRWTDAEFGRYRLLYVAPERLQSELFLARASRLNVARLAVDEAHCISEWGVHFRPAYRRILEARRLLNDPPTLALTATATPAVRRDIIEQLGLADPRIVVHGFDRPNLIWTLFRTRNKRRQVLEVLTGVPGSAILYAATRQGVMQWAEWLSGQGIASLPYHGGLPDTRRTAVQEAWMQDTVRVIVATNAFGMGIDKPDVRAVIHVDMPGSLEEYYQEAGRAGRDGERAYAVLLYHEQDKATRQALIEESHPVASDLRAVYDAALNLAQVPVAGLPDSPITLNLEGIRRLTGFSPGKIRTAVDLLARHGTWQVLPARRHRGLIRFNQPADAVRRYAEGLQGKALRDFVGALLRTVHADAFSTWWDIDVRRLEKRTGLARERLYRGLQFLEERGLLSFRPPEESIRIVPAEHRSAHLPLDDVMVRRARRRAEHNLADMCRYARSVTCRRQFLLAYFGEASPSRCGKCDLCMGRHRPVVITPEDEPVLRTLLQQVQMDPCLTHWSLPDTRPAHQIEGFVDWLVQEGYLTVRDPLETTFEITEKAREWMSQWMPRAGS